MAEKGSIQVTVVGATDVGQVRDHNEDSLLVADLTAAERADDGQTIQRELGERGLLMAVADGMGGAASGEIASQTAVDTVFENFSRKEVTEGAGEPEQVRESLTDSLNTANTSIYDRGQEEAEHRGMGTTMTAAFVLGDTVHFAQVGDSRAYLLRKGKLNQVTKDQSLISQLIEEGTLTEEEAEKLGGRNIILQALGVEPTVKVETKSLEILDGDVLALCSDGLSGMVKDDLLQSTLAGAEDLGATAKQLIDMANDAGGRDNITVILVRFEGAGLRQPLRPLEAEQGAGGGDKPVTSFAAPEPPEEPAAKSKFRLVFFAGIAILILAAVAVLLSGGTGNLTLVFPEGATGVRAELRPQSGDGEPIVLEAGPDQHEVRFPELAAGQYLLHASRAGFTDVMGLPVDVRGDVRLDVDKLRPLPGSLVLVLGTSRVTVRIREKVPGRPPFDFSEENVEAGELIVNSVPAGVLLVQVSRGDDFRAVTGLEVTLAPGEMRHRVEIPALAPRNGTAVIEYLPGAEISVTDDHNEPIGDPVTVPASGVVEIPVRQGTERRIVAVHPTLEPAEAKFDIKEGQKLSVPLERVDRRGTIEVTGPVEARVQIRLAGGEELPRRGRLLAGDDGLGRHKESNLPPGDYTIEMTAGERTETRSLKLAPGGAELVEFTP